MKIVRFNPRYNRMRRFNEFADWPRWETNVNLGLAVDVAEKEDAFVVKASVPGITPDDLDVTFEDDMLTIKGEVAEDKEINEENYHVRERRYGSFGRCIRFPVNVNADAVEAKYENGVLTLTVPKAEEVKPRRIEVHVN